MRREVPNSQCIIDGIAYNETISGNLGSKASKAGNSYRKSLEDSHS